MTMSLLIISVLIVESFGAINYPELFESHLPSNVGEDERLQYYEVWKENVRFINEHNAKSSTYKLGINKFTHLLPHQVPKLGQMRPTSGAFTSFSSLADPPTEVDWRVKGDVSPVHNEGEMGCSFEIVFADVVTSLHAIRTGQLVPFNPQQLIDCCTEDCKCNQLKEPGQLANCIKKHGGLCPDYPSSTECTCKKCNEKPFMIKGMREVQSGNETALQYAVAMEPVMVGIDAGQQSFQLYKEGIYSDEDCSSTELDHLLLVVGYGSDNGTDYWLCKNSWGVDWGMRGYVKIARNAHNMCGIATAAYYPY